MTKEFKKRILFLYELDSLNGQIEKLELQKEELRKQFSLNGVIHWVELKSNIKPNEDTEECLVKYEDGKVRTALFSQEDFRFYNSMNSQDITEQIKYYCDLPK
jgi:hypothetical protein